MHGFVAAVTGVVLPVTIATLLAITVTNLCQASSRRSDIMNRVLTYSLLLVAGLGGSQLVPSLLGTRGEPRPCSSGWRPWCAGVHYDATSAMSLRSTVSPSSARRRLRVAATAARSLGSSYLFTSWSCWPRWGLGASSTPENRRSWLAASPPPHPPGFVLDVGCGRLSATWVFRKARVLAISTTSTRSLDDSPSRC